MKIKNIIKRIRKEEFIVIFISSELSMDFNNNKIMLEIIEKNKPTYWKLLNPDGYIVYYLNNNKNEYFSKTLYNDVSDLIVNEDIFSKYRIGVSQGTMIAKFSFSGKLIEEPLGLAANEAKQSLKGKSQMQT